MKFIVMGLMMMAAGAYYLVADSGGLWARHEHRARARGVVSLQRTPEWESAIRNSGWGFVIIGALILLMGFWLPGAKARRSQAQPS